MAVFWLSLVVGSMLMCATASPSLRAVEHAGTRRSPPSFRCVEGPTVPLWPAGEVVGARGLNGSTDVPKLQVFHPPVANSTGASMVVLPGGGYMILSDYEGAGYARFLCSMGIASYVLTYRLGSNGYHMPVQLHDVTRAVRLVRAKLLRPTDDTNRVGVIGSSAGGHLAGCLMAYHDLGDPNASDPIERQSSRPDLGALIYPLVSMNSSLTHAQSRESLLGSPNPPPDLVRRYSVEQHVNGSFPPTFIHANLDDQVVPVGGAMKLIDALEDEAIPYQTALYGHGQHGLGLYRDYLGTEIHPWTRRLTQWLVDRGFADGRPSYTHASATPADRG